MPVYLALLCQLRKLYSLFSGVAVASFFGSETMEFSGERQQQIGDFSLAFQMRTRSENANIFHIETENAENVTVSCAQFNLAPPVS